MSEIPFELFQQYCDVAREFNEYAPPERVVQASRAPSTAKGNRPGDEFNRQISWADILEPHGWRPERVVGEVTYWTRPGKSRGVSATTGKCRSESGNDLLYVFTTNAPPFDGEDFYDKFGAFTRLNHAGDFSVAAKDVAEKLGLDNPAAESNYRVTIPSGYQTPQQSSYSVANTPPDGRPFLWSSELKRLPKTDKWIWEGYLSRGGVTLLSALWKAGKSTLLSHLVKAFGDGSEKFCGLAIKQSRILYVTEEDQTTWAERRDNLQFGDHVGWWCRPFVGRPNVMQWRQFIERIVLQIEQHKFDLIVFDTLSKLWCVREENDANQVEEALMPLWKITDSGTALLMVHHMRKSGGDEFVGGRGSGGLPAFAETLMELRRYDAKSKTDTRRVLTAAGRFQETPDEVVVSLENNQFVPLGTISDVRKADGDDVSDPEVIFGPKSKATIAEWILHVLPTEPPGLKSDDVMEAIRARRTKGFNQKNFDAEIYSLARTGRIGISGGSVKSDPLRYWKRDDGTGNEPIVPNPSEVETELEGS